MSKEEEATATASADDSITIYSLAGSQYVAKVIVALQGAGIPHYVEEVSMHDDKRREQLPSGGKMVPEMKCGDIIMNESEEILKWMDANRGSNFYPNEEAKEISVRASDGILSGGVLYYNWVNLEGYRRSMRYTISDAVLPGFIPGFLKRAILDLAIGKKQKAFGEVAKKRMGLESLEDEEKVKQVFLDELKYFQSLLKDEDQEFLLPTKEPTAADYSVYGQIERVVGDMGDADVPAAWPMLKTGEPTSEELKRFWKWHDNMRAKYPIHFNGRSAADEKKE